jgi:hypothetical protein
VIAAPPADPRILRDDLVIEIRKFIRELGGRHGSGEDEETEEARRTDASEGRADQFMRASR